MGCRTGEARVLRKKRIPAEAGIGSRHIQKGPETICDLGTGVPHHSQLELRCGVPHGLGGAAKAGGLDSLCRFIGS